ncbi:MAG TPA: type 2 lanthipeptide synthetase LanM family protein [Ktedonobacterales bacterium]
MAKGHSSPTSKDQASLETSNWFLATTLAERLALLHLQTSRPGVHITRRARTRLQHWQAEYVFKEALSFAERLEMEGMTKEELLILFSLPSETLQIWFASSAVSRWRVELAYAFGTPPSAPDKTLPYEPGTEKVPLPLFVQPIEPLLRGALARLQEGIDTLARRYAVLPFEVLSVTTSLFTQLVWRLSSLLTRTLVLELNVARLQQRLQGETPEQRFEDFVHQLCQGKVLVLLEEYPVLARQLILAIDQWVSYSVEILGHLCADWAELCATFALGTEAEPLTTIRMEVGDRHRDGRSVLILTFRSGTHLVYKPKSLALDAHFQELLVWLNACGCTPPLATLKVINKGTYGWSEYVEAHGCTEEAEAQRFYERQGAYLALLSVLEATDVHFENVIAAGEQPLLIDLETLMHPDVGLSDGAEHPVGKALRHSVLRVGLLPHREYGGEEYAGIDLSGLGGQQGQFTPHPASAWEQAGTDAMHAVHRQVQLAAGQNLPKLNGQEVALLDTRQAFKTGFTRMYRLLMAQRETFLQDYLPRFHSDEVRVVLRPTTLYGLLVQGSLHPDHLRDGLDRDRFLDRLYVGSRQLPHRASIIAAERAALPQGDIPLFTTRPESRDLWTCQGECLPDFFRQSSYDAAQARLQHLSEEDLQRQLWLIEASFTSLLVEAHQLTRRERHWQPTSVSATSERLLAEALAIGEKLHEQTLQDENRAGWLCLSHLQHSGWSVQAADTTLYDGASGIVLFLAYLGALTGQANYTSLAWAALKTVQDALEQQRQRREYPGIGAFQGLSSPIYLFCHLGVLWSEPALLRECGRLIALLPTLIEQDTRFDIIGGAAGCILTLLGVHHVTSDPAALAIACHCGDHLFQHASQMPVGVGWKQPYQNLPLAGFSHGAAGIAYSLLALAAASGETRFKQMALAALAYERSLYIPAAQNWLDLREGNEEAMKNKRAKTEKEHLFMTAWCHGAPGIGLARLASLPYLDDPQLREEIRVACETTATQGFGWNHSLCHGDLGNLETLLVAARTLKSPIYHEQVDRLAGMLLDEHTMHKWVTGVPIAVETPGLMTGMAGIGYELLRLAAPEQIPSVLLLSPPDGPIQGMKDHAKHKEKGGDTDEYDGLVPQLLCQVGPGTKPRPSSRPRCQG